MTVDEYRNRLKKSFEVTREEARRILIQEMESLKANPNVIVDDCLYEAFDTAIKALEQPSFEEWLSSFNTNSAPQCFNAVQQLKEKLNAKN